MKKPPVGPNEIARLQALADLEILDTAPDPSFDDITRLASAICQTPIALISLVDDKRQWFKSRVGLEAEETSRDLAFCAHAIYESKVFIVEDSSKDDRFFDNPLVTDAPHVRFYAGAQLKTEAGHTIGTLCVIDHEPRYLTDEQKSALETLSRVVVQMLEGRKAGLELSKKFHELQQLGKRVADQQNELQLSANLKTLGNIAANLSHEINNPLMIILGNLSMMTKTLCKLDPAQSKLAEEMKERLGGVEEAAQRISKVMKSLSFLADQKEGIPPSPKHVREIVETVLDLVKEQIIALEIKWELSVDVDKPVLCQAPRICQAILNLVLNAIDAVYNLPRDQRWIKIRSEFSKETWSLFIQDSGRGVPAELRSEIMKPFVTTKKNGNGGLGLSVAKAFVEAHGGTVVLDEREKNTTFVLTLPLECKFNE